MGIYPILSLFILALVRPSNGLDEVPMGRVCARNNCCAADTVCATKVSCPFWQAEEKKHPKGSAGYGDLIKRQKSVICNARKAALCCPTGDPSSLPLAGQCGVNPDAEFIFGGEDTKPGEFPYSVLLGVTVKDRVNRKTVEFPLWNCAGVLINPWYVVTAGHCVRGPKPIEWVRAGGHLVEDEFKGQTPKYGTQLPPYQQQRITEEDIIVHEGYGQKGNNIVDDIALIRLPERVQTNKGTQFACMPTPNNASYAALEDWSSGSIGHSATVVGWGYSCYENGTRSFCDTGAKQIPTKIQQKLKVPVVSGSTCQGVGFDIDPDLQVCAGGERGKSACRGDSGGGLFINDEDGGPWYLFGIVSFGGFDCEAEIPEAYTRVSSYVDWIVAQMKKYQ